MPYSMNVRRSLCCLILIPSLVLPACDSIPRDADGTVDRISQNGRMRVTVVSGTRQSAPGAVVAQRLADELGAVAMFDAQPASLALHDLDDGETDLVIGEFARSGSVSKDASLSDAIGQPEPRDGEALVLRLARKKGENRLITKTDSMIMR